MRIFLCILLPLLWGSSNAFGQLQSATLQATGLTCSMCSKATFKKLQAIEGVQKITPDLDNTSFVLQFSPNNTTPIASIQKQVEAAGFSVGKLVLNYKIPATTIANNTAVAFKGGQLIFIETAATKKEGVVQLQVVNKGFITDKEFKKLQALATKYPGYDKAAPNQYFVKLL
jgi:copper chaperone CopZ